MRICPEPYWRHGWYFVTEKPAAPLHKVVQEAAQLERPLFASKLLGLPEAQPPNQHKATTRGDKEKL